MRAPACLCEHLMHAGACGGQSGHQIPGSGVLGTESQSSTGAAIALVLVRASVAGVKQREEKQVGDKGVHFISQLVVHHSGRQGRN